MNNDSDEMLDDYSELFDYSKAVREKYYEQAMRAKNSVQLDAEILPAIKPVEIAQ